MLLAPPVCHATTISGSLDTIDSRLIAKASPKTGINFAASGKSENRTVPTTRDPTFKLKSNSVKCGASETIRLAGPDKLTVLPVSSMTFISAPQNDEYRKTQKAMALTNTSPT